MAAPELLRLGDVMRERRAAFAATHLEQRRAIAAAPARAKRSIYAGAGFGRLNSDWIMGPMSADAALEGDLQTLRDRCRELARDNPLAKRFLRLCVTNIIGPKGMRLIPQVIEPDGEGLDEKVNQAITKAWRKWTRREFASASRRLSFVQIERMLVRTWKGEGEFLAQIVVGASNLFGFTLQPLDNDQLDHTLKRAPAPGVNEIRMGVEIDPWGAPVAYWVWTAHPTDRARDRRRERIPADRIIHVYDEERPGQTRAISSLAAALKKLKMSDGADEALLVLVRTAACKMGFLESTDDADEPEEDENNPTAAVPMDASPGSIERLPYGTKFTGWDPGQPTSEYAPFTRRIDRGIAAAVDVSYASLTGDLSEGNYSSTRIGMLTERDGWESDQELVISLFHERVFRAWLPWALLSGQLQLPFDLDRYLAPDAVRLQPRGFDWIDPSKDIDAALREVDAGLTTLTDLAAERGRDFAEIVRRRKAETELAKAAGVTINLSPKPAAPLALPTPKADTGATND